MEPLEGTSFASPIVAGVAALVLEFARQPPINGDESVVACLRRRRGMRLVLLEMAITADALQRFRFVAPWKLFHDETGRHGGDGGATSERYFVAKKLVKILRQDFGPDIGKQVFG